MFLDLALKFDPASRTCDLALAPGARGLVLAVDRTPATALLASLGADRRALPDDQLPDGSTEGSVAAGINPRRGWSGDALDALGRRAGSRLWLLERAKQTEDVRGDAEEYAAEATAWIAEREGVEVGCAAAWVRRNVLALQVRVMLPDGPQTLTVQRRLGAGGAAPAVRLPVDAPADAVLLDGAPLLLDGMPITLGAAAAVAPTAGVPVGAVLLDGAPLLLDGAPVTLSGDPVGSTGMA